MGSKKKYMRKPKRGEVWLAVDMTTDANKQWKQYSKDSVQKGTRPCIIVSNNRGNDHSSVLEVVYATKQKKTNLPTHFVTEVTPIPSTVMCEQIMTIPVKHLKRYYGKISKEEEEQLNECLRISIGL